MPRGERCRARRAGTGRRAAAPAPPGPEPGRAARERRRAPARAPLPPARPSRERGDLAAPGQPRGGGGKRGEKCRRHDNFQGGRENFKSQPSEQSGSLLKAPPRAGCSLPPAPRALWRWRRRGGGRPAASPRKRRGAETKGAERGAGPGRRPKEAPSGPIEPRRPPRAARGQLCASAPHRAAPRPLYPPLPKGLRLGLPPPPARHGARSPLARPRPSSPHRGWANPPAAPSLTHTVHEPVPPGVEFAADSSTLRRAAGAPALGGGGRRSGSRGGHSVCSLFHLPLTSRPLIYIRARAPPRRAARSPDSPPSRLSERVPAAPPPQHPGRGARAPPGGVIDTCPRDVTPFCIFPPSGLDLSPPQRIVVR